MRESLSKKRKWLSCALLLLGVTMARPAAAHWCSNIWTAPSRMLIKPEKSTVYVGSAPVKLRVFFQNNFPYKLFGVQMKGSAPGYNISVSPGQQDINPGQNVSFIYTITKNSGSATLSVSNMALKVAWRPGHWPYSDWDMNHAVVDQSPSQSYMLNKSKYSMSYQEASLTVARMAELHPNTPLGSGSPFAGRTAMEQLINWFGYRYCYSSSGGYRCGSQDCCGGPDCKAPCKEGSPWTSTDTFPHNAMRAGVDLVQFHARAMLGSHLDPARLGAAHALRGTGSVQHKCLAAVVGAYLWFGAPSTSKFTQPLNDSGNKVPKDCRDAAMRILTGSPALNCNTISSYSHTERAACAAAEGLRGQDGPVNSILKAGAGDGYNPSGGDYKSLYYAYMLYIVTAHRKNKVGHVSFYPDAGGAVPPKPDAKPPKPDQKVPKPDTKPPKPDQKVPKPDAKPPKPDAKPPKPDAKVPKPDAKVPKPDQKVPKPDAKPSKDGAVKKDGAGKKDSAIKKDSTPKSDQKVKTDALSKTDSGGIPIPIPKGKGCDCNLGGSPYHAPLVPLLVLLALAGILRRRYH